MDNVRRAHWLDNDRVYYLTVAAVLAPALLIRLVGLNKGIWIDEYHSLMFPVEDGWVQTIKNLRNNDWPPLYFLLIDIWSQISSAEAFLRLLSVIFGLGTIIVVMRWIKGYSRLASVLAGLYLASTPSMLRYSQEIRGYSLLVFATGLAFYFASQVAAEPAKLSGYAGMALSLIVAVSTHMVGVMLLAPLIVFVMLTSDLRKVSWRRIIATMALPAGMFGFFYFVYLQNVNKNETWWINELDVKRVLTVAANSLAGLATWKLWPESVVPFVFFLLLTLTVAILVWGEWRVTFPFLAAVIVYWLEVILYGIWFTPILVTRTVLPSLVPFSGWLGLQIATIQNARFRTGIIAACLVFGASVSTTWLIKVAGTPAEPFREMSQAVRSEWRPGDVVVWYGSDLVEGTVRYYFSELPPDAGVTVSSTYSNFDQLGLEIEQKLAAHSAARDSLAIVVIARIDVGKDHTASEYQSRKRETHRELLQMLRSRYGPPISSQTYGKPLVVTTYDARAGK